MLELSRVQLTYPGAPGPVLDDFSLDMEKGELLTVLGPSGCGKSTLLKLVAGLLTPQAGSLRYTPDKRGRRSHYDRILVLQQDNQLFPWLTVLQNVSLPLRRIGVPDWRGRSEAILARLQIPRTGGLYPHQLSGGMRQRAVLARALAADPALLLLDEPFAHLDAAVRQSLQQLVVDIWRGSGRSVIFVTHDIAEALILAGRVVVLNRYGRIIDDAVIDLPRPRDPYTPEVSARIRYYRTLLD